LENNGLIIRKSRPVIPPYVTYELLKSGKALRSVFYAMAEWAVNNSGKQLKQFFKQMEDFPLE